ncbi:MAG: type IV pilus assembly protein PilM [Halanaerobacter sp.]
MEIIEWLKTKLNKLGQNKVIGLDIGEKTIKLTQAETKDGIIQLNKLAILETPSGVLEKGRLVDIERLAAVLSKALEENGFDGNRVVTAISGENVINRIIKMPSMPEEELDDTVKWEAGEQIRLSVDEASIDYEILSRGADGSYKLLLVAVKEDLIEQYLSLFQHLELVAEGVETEPLALGRLSKNLEFDKTVCIIDIGFQTTDISVLNQGCLLFTRTISMSGKEISEEIAKDYQMTLAEAEAYKKTNNLFLNDELPKVIRNLTTSIYRSLDYFQVENEDYELERIFLTGGSSKLLGYDKYLAEEIGVDVDSFKLGDHFRLNLPNTNQNYLQQVFPQMLVSIGLALRGEEND